MKLSLYEQETIILYNQAEAAAEVYTNDPRLLEKLRRLAEKYPDQIVKKDRQTFTVPKRCVSVREPYSDERRKAASERANLILSKSRKDERELYRQYLYQSLDIEILKERYPYGVEGIDEIFDIILDVLCSNQKFITISGDKKPINVVKSRFMKLDSSHIQFVIDSMKDKTTKVRNVKKYIVAALYNAPITINNYYSSLVQHDMATGKI